METRYKKIKDMLHILIVDTKVDILLVKSGC